MFGALFKGWLGEKVTQLGLWHHLDEQVYRRFHDVIVPARNGTTQIDHVLVSCYGIFVVETKNYNGWIFGDEHAPQWTVSHFGKKFQFQNPLRQNFRHTQCLAEHLRLDPSKFRSVVFFVSVRARLARTHTLNSTCNVASGLTESKNLRADDGPNG